MCFCGPSGVSVCQPCLVLVEVVEALVEPMLWSPHACPVHCVFLFFFRVHLHVESLELYMYDLYIILLILVPIRVFINTFGASMVDELASVE